jgi:hypothetical protein
MKKFFLSLAGAALLAGTMAAVPETAQAAQWHGHHHRQVCRIVVKNKVVWRHGRKHVVPVKVRRCWNP